MSVQRSHFSPSRERIVRRPAPVAVMPAASDRDASCGRDAGHTAHVVNQLVLTLNLAL